MKMKTRKYIISGLAVIAGLFFTACTEKFDEPYQFSPVNMQTTTTIKAFKAMYTGGPLEIRDDIVIGGKVVSSDEQGNFYRSFYIQDQTGGIEIKIGKTTLYNEYKEGQTIFIKAKHLFLGTYGGMVQLGERSTDPKYETSYIDTDLRIKETIFRGVLGSKVTPLNITTASQVNDDLLGTIVTLKNAKYTRQNMTTWAKKATTNSEAAYGEHTFQVGGSVNVVVRTSGYAKFASEPVPALNTYADVTGVFTKFGTTYQLVLLSLDGVKPLQTPAVQ
jgi:hypothetical protein